jgi:hypothetical protein
MFKNYFELFFLCLFLLVLLPNHLSQANSSHLLIVEVQIQGENINDDYIKIFNPLDQDLDVSGYKLRKRTSTGRESSIRVFPQETIIPSKGYLIWANKNYAAQIGAQLQSSATLAKNNSIALLNPQGEIIDAVAWGNSDDPYKEGEVFPDNPLKNQKLIRKQETGIYLDTDNNAGDFYLKEKLIESNGENNKGESTKKTQTSSEISVSFGQNSLGSINPRSKNHPPIAEAGPDIFTLTEKEVHFDAGRSSDPDGDKLSYFWNFGDGQTSKERNPLHKYSYPGSYLVILEVSDGKEKSTDNLKVTVYPRGVIINEIYPNSEGEDKNKEWLEIYNANPYSVDISGYQIKTRSKNFIFPQNSFVLGKQFLVIQPKVSLPNKNGEIQFLYPNNWLIQKVTYSEVKEGQSLVFFNNNFYFSKIITPGQKNLLYLGQKEIQPEKEGQIFEVQSLSPQTLQVSLKNSNLKDFNPTLKINESNKQEKQKQTLNLPENQLKSSIKAQVRQISKENLTILIFPLILGILSLTYFFVIKKPF